MAPKEKPKKPKPSKKVMPRRGQRKPPPPPEHLPDDPMDLYIQDATMTTNRLASLYAGRQNCSQAKLYSRCAKENWMGLRKQFHKKKAEAAGRIEGRFIAKTLAALNAEHFETIELLRKINQTFLRQKIGATTDGDGNPALHVLANDQELRRIQQNLKELAEWERLINNYPTKDPVKDAGTDDVQGSLNDDDLAILEAYKNG